MHGCMWCGNLHFNGMNNFCSDECEKKFIRWQGKQLRNVTM